MNFSNKLHKMYMFFLAFSIIFTMGYKIIDEVSPFDDIKYLLFIVTIVIGISHIYFKKISIIFKKEFFLSLVLIAIFFLLSVAMIIINKTSFQLRTVIELVYIFIPFTIAFLSINICTKDEIMILMKVLLILCLCIYIIELLSRNITLNQLLSISFINSYSPFESYIFADFSLISFCFFSYYKNYNHNYILSNNICYYVSFIFSILTFKRILVLFSILLFAIEKFNIFKIKVNKKIIILICIVFFIVTLIYTWLLSYSNSEILYNLIGLDLDKLTVGRQWYLSLIQNSNYLSSGYGSTTTALMNILGPSRYLEMDLVKIVIEITPIGLMTFLYVYWNQIYNNVFSVLLMTFFFVNMIFSHNLTTFYVWILTLLLFYMIKKENINNHDINIT